MNCPEQSADKPKPDMKLAIARRLRIALERVRPLLGRQTIIDGELVTLRLDDLQALVEAIEGRKATPRQ